ncbi:hypothetical protein V8C86DRAFT_2563555 [Haematococcus lacustris]
MPTSRPSSPSAAQRLTPLMAEARVATGRLAKALGVAGETERVLVGLDCGWEGLGGALDRLLTWGADMADKRDQLEQVATLRQRCQEAEAQAVAAAATVADLQAALAGWELRAAAAEQELRSNAEAVAAHRAAAAGEAAERESLRQRLQSCQEELAGLSEKHVLMEQEYWVIKARLLDAELSTGELVAARERALSERARMAARMEAAEKELSEHRGQRQQLEADVVGLKAWVRTMQKTEEAYRKVLQELAELQDTAEANAAEMAALRDLVQKLGGDAQRDTTEDRGESDAEARISAAVAISRAAELARLEMTSLLAEVRRHDEETSDLLRHAECDKRELEKKVAQLAADLSIERQRADALSSELLSMQLEVRQREAERGLTLAALVNARIQAAAADDAAAFAAQPRPPDLAQQGRPLGGDASSAGTGGATTSDPAARVRESPDENCAPVGYNILDAPSTHNTTTIHK